jgi:mannosyl-3-phosphoglycerate phosphatase
MSSVPLFPILVFSDLDGTLIDHVHYKADAAKPALDALRACGGGLIMASSKTGPEIARIRDALGWSDWPAIVENGAGVLAAQSPDDQLQKADTSQYDAVRDVLAKTPKDLRQYFRGFADMTVSEVAQITGLDADAAGLACQRAFSEPGIWLGDDDQRHEFLAYLTGHGVAAREGGRFLTLSFGQTKADRMAALIAQFKPEHTVALGDAPNDIEMLETADFGVIVANPHRAALPALKGENQGLIMRTTLPGPHGWNLAVLALLSKLEIE